MFLKNFNALLISSSYAEQNGAGSTMFQIVGIDGNKYTPTFNGYNKKNDLDNMRVFVESIIIGDSDAPVIYNQYNIQGNEIVLNNVVKKYSYAMKENGTLELAIQIKGIPTDNAIIKEIGLIKPIYNNDTKITDALMYREVLEEPITLEANVEANMLFKIQLLIK